MDPRHDREQWLLRALADLGPILCLHRIAEAHALIGLKRAVSLCVQVRIDSDGICECLEFRDASGETCWRLCLLPDSNYWAWDRILSRVHLEAGADPQKTKPLSERAYWRCCPLRLHACATVSGPTLAAAPVQLSQAGTVEAARLARMASGGRLAAV